MHTEGNEVHVSTEEASGGSREGVVRWVLVLGTLLAILALSAIWIGGALSTDDPDADNANVSAKIAAEQDQDAATDTDSIVSPTSSATAAADDQTSVKNGDPVVTN
jgi:hypothetical protein